MGLSITPPSGITSGGPLGTPSSGTLTNATGLPQSGVTDLVSDLALKAPLASPTFTGTLAGVTANFTGVVTVNVPNADALAYKVAKVQTANATGTQFKFFGGAAGTTVRGQLGFTHTGAGLDTIFTGETVDAFAVRAENDLILGGGADNIGLRINNTVISSKPIRLKGYTVATLPAGTQGDTAFVTDAVTPAFSVTVVGGGAAITTVFYNGTNWVVQ